MVTKLNFIILVSCIVSCSTAADNIFMHGTGTLNDPYQITSFDQIVKMGSQVEYFDKHFVLKNDITVDKSFAAFNHAVIAPRIGEYDKSFKSGMMGPQVIWQGGIFTGSFNGNGHCIRRLCIKCTDCYIGCVGLFGRIGKGAEIYNLGIEQASITVSGKNERSDFIGLLAGQADGAVIRACWATGSIKGPEQSYGYGGLVGKLINGHITESYAAVDITGDYHLGGLVGTCTGSTTIDHCYSMSNLTGNGVGGLVAIAGRGCCISKCYAAGKINHGYNSAGGLVGSDGRDSVVKYSFWDVNSTGITTHSEGIGLTTDQFKDLDILSSNGWAQDTKWRLKDDMPYAQLCWQCKNAKVIPKADLSWIKGRGTNEDPYLIFKTDQLAKIGMTSILWHKHFKLMCDLDLAGIKLRPIGVSQSNSFTGSFNGNHYVISNFTISNSEVGLVNYGLFGVIGPKAKVIDLTMKNALVHCGDNSESIGILAGSIRQAFIRNCCVAGKVITGDYCESIGGICGYSVKSLINNCRALVNISTGDESSCIGCITGACFAVHLEAGDKSMRYIVKCAARGNITVGDKSRLIGGLTGYNWGYCIGQCSVQGRIIAGKHIRQTGGLIGYNRGESRVENSFADSFILTGSMPKQIGGLIGDHSAETVKHCYSNCSIAVNGKGVFIGGLIGDSCGSGILGCFWHHKSKKISFSDNKKGIHLNTDQMQDINTYLNAGWDFTGETENGTKDIWYFDKKAKIPYLCK